MAYFKFEGTSQKSWDKACLLLCGITSSSNSV